MTATYDMGIRTNHDAWQAVHDGLRDGLTKLQISERAGISYQMVGVYSRMASPASIVRKINRHHEGPTFGACGHVVAWATDPNGTCDDCMRKRAAAEANVPARRELLRSWALRNGRVPTTAEARDLLGISRAHAGEMLREAFGPDPRDGAQRRKAYRGWPEGAPDVPNEAGLEHMRECGRRYGTKNLAAGRTR